MIRAIIERVKPDLRADSDGRSQDTIAFLQLLERPQKGHEYGFDPILANSLKNFNSDPKREFIRERELLREVLEATW